MTATESYIQTAPDSLGKKVRVIEETVGANTVYTPVTVLEDGAGTLIKPALEAGGNLATIATNTASLAAATATEAGNYSTNWIGVLCVAGAGAYTKGSYVQAIAATAATTKKLMVNMIYTATDSAQHQIILDVATGAAGAETVLIPNIFFQTPLPIAANGSYASGYITFDVAIPSGTRLAVRVGGNTAYSHTSVNTILLE